MDTRLGMQIIPRTVTTVDLERLKIIPTRQLLHLNDGVSCVTDLPQHIEPDAFDLLILHAQLKTSDSPMDRVSSYLLSSKPSRYIALTVDVGVQGEDALVSAFNV